MVAMSRGADVGGLLSEPTNPATTWTLFCTLPMPTLRSSLASSSPLVSLTTISVFVLSIVVSIKVLLTSSSLIYSCSSICTSLSAIAFTMSKYLLMPAWLTARSWITSLILDSVQHCDTILYLPYFQDPKKSLKFTLQLEIWALPQNRSMCSHIDGLAWKESKVRRTRRSNWKPKDVACLSHCLGPDTDTRLLILMDNRWQELVVLYPPRGHFYCWMDPHPILLKFNSIIRLQA